MITKKLFKKTIDEIHKFHLKIKKLDDIGFYGTSNELVENSHEDILIEVLCSEFKDKKNADEIIAWWIYETEFGNKNPRVIVGKGKNKKQLFLDTPECLYDFLKGDY